MNATTEALTHPVNAACARLGIGRNTLYELIHAGEIRPIHAGRRTLIPESELRAFVERQLAKASTKAAA